MSRNTLREISKFLSGLVLGDFLAVSWIYVTGTMPLNVFGIQFSNQGIIIGMIFDIILFIFLVHYGWRIKESGHTSTERTFHRVAGIIFALVAIAHFLRIVFDLPINLLTWNTPYWASGIAVVIASFLSYSSFRFTKRK